MVNVILKQSFLMSRQTKNAMFDPPTPPLGHHFALSEK